MAEHSNWAESGFNIDTIHSYDATIEASNEEWIGRIKSCREVDASLSAEKIAEFEREYHKILEKYDTDTLN